MVSYALGTFGAVVLWVAFAAAALAAILLGVNLVQTRKLRASDQVQIEGTTSARILKAAHILIFVVAVALIICAGVLVHGFYTHNVAIQYVAQNYPSDTGSLFWLYQLSGLWASRAGSLLTWAGLISLFASWIAWHHRRNNDRLTSAALAVIMVVLLFFMAVMTFSQDNNPFVLTDPSLIDANGNLVGPAVVWGMNVLLEHWAMVLHPPILFIGYAGMTVPFAYALAALICGDMSRRWVQKCTRMTLFAFVFLTVGIGLGAVWAYVVLGWGGYWGWDPVENASLLSWLTAVAMIHSFTAYRTRGMMAGWSVATAALTFFFVILGTFITRSGIVESVHAFSKDPVSTYSFLGLMIFALASVLIGWIVRRRSVPEADDIESVVSRNGSYYLTNLIMVFSAILVAYLTIASALPTWLPAGGMTIGALAYESVARPLGTLFCLLAAVCPFLAWKKTDGAQFWKTIRIPAAVAVVVFIGLLIYFIFNLYPTYLDNLAQGDMKAIDLMGMGPSWYYNGLAIVALLVASLLAANSCYLIVRGIRTRMSAHGEKFSTAFGHFFWKTPAQAGGYLTHLGLGIVLVGLVGSSMYVIDRTVQFRTPGETIDIGSYTLVYQGDSNEMDEQMNMVYQTSIDCSRDGKDLGHMTPTLELTASSFYGQTRVTAEVRSSFAEDLFVAFQGYESDGAAVVNARVNPLISLVWTGFFLMGLGIVCAALPRRRVMDAPDGSVQKVSTTDAQPALGA